MIDVMEALHQFWSQFGIPAFVEGTVPDEMPNGNGGTVKVEMPYITYHVAIPEWKNSASTYARIWYRSTSFNGLFRKVAQISNAIGEGISIPLDNGCLVLFKDSLFCQYMPDETDDANVKTAYLSLVEHVFH